MIQMMSAYTTDMIYRLLLLTLGLSIAPAWATEVVQINNQELQQLLEQGVPLIDVRTTTEWQQTGIIKNSHLLTFFDENGRYDAQAWLQQLSVIVSPEQPVAFICAVGGRTQAITHFLTTQLRYQKVYNVSQGIRAWISAGYPTVAQPAPTQNSAQN